MTTNFKAYSLTIIPDNRTLLRTIHREEALRGGDTDFADALTPSGRTREPWPWRSPGRDLRRISKAHPGVLFKLLAVGESGQHMYFARDGRSECVRATIVFVQPRWMR